MLSVRIVALRLSAVQVVTISAPRSASSLVRHETARIPSPARFLTALRVAAGSMSAMRTVSIAHKALNASAWNSHCAPAPMIAIVRAPAGRRYLAASAEVAAVRSAVRIVISERSIG